ncbi:GH25 family lysozyme, partial [Alloscardovia omnicolens]
MSKIRHRLLAIVALLLAMLTITPSAMADIRGIDVSGWQPPTVICTTDYDFSVVKATQGTGFTNGYMTSQARCAQQRGKSLGFYHYAGGGNATAEADYFVNTVRPYIGRAILVLDWEGYQNAAWGNFNWVRISVNRVHAGTGVWPLVYTSAAYLYQIPSDVRSRCGLWGGAIRQQQRHRLPDATVELRAL